MKIGSFRSRAVAAVASPHSASRRHHRRQERGSDLARTTSLTRRRHQPYTLELVAKAVRASHKRPIRIDVSFRARQLREARTALADPKTTPLNSSHTSISYALFSLKKKT